MKRKFVFTLISVISPLFTFASGGNADPITFSGIPLEFILFALTLLGVALFHKYTLRVALIGLTSILILKLGFLDFDIQHHLWEESSILLNLLGLLLGFAILANLFEESMVPKLLPKILPDDWKGPFFLLAFIFVLSALLDNIAAALIGGSIAHIVFRGKVHIGYLAAIVAASNAGGSGSVLGDTTTTMMWIDGVNPLDVIHAYGAAIPAFLFFGVFASLQQHKYHPILKGAYEAPKVNYKNLVVCLLILVGAIVTNFVLEFPSAGVWAAILIGSFFIKIKWEELLKAIPGSLFLLSLVLCASMMPVDQLPAASWQTTFSLGFISSVFDNIPLTKLALDQMGYDWGVLAYAVGFGGSMIWFGSSAGVAISNMYPEAKSVSNWVKGGWHVIVGYIIGFAVLMLTIGWNPHTPHKTVDSSQGIHVEDVVE
ncbi:MAG: citrate transporter [Bacteroidetes bacterium]|nr:citrate transporter [Bacteroidota bacterium]